MDGISKRGNKYTLWERQKPNVYCNKLDNNERGKAIYTTKAKSKLATSDEAAPHATTARSLELHSDANISSELQVTTAENERVVSGARRAQVIER